MKELSVEQKAKAYDEALEKAKEFKNNPFAGYDGTDLISALFPELAESEDERIRKALINQFSDYKRKGENHGFGYSNDKILAWLEKQGEQKCTTEEVLIKAGLKPYKDGNQWCILLGDNIQEGVCGFGDTIDDALYAFLNDLIKSQKEQKLVDNIEPKFKVGDWVIDKQDIVHQIANVIENVTYHTYDYDIVGGGYFNDNTEGVRLWTIQDAKDGDVLACESGWTCIFKTLVNDETFSSYCFMDKTKWFCETGSECHTLNKEFMKVYNGEIYPATKEQRDLLFQKMKDTGYTFDFEKKELKKIEKNPAENEELTEFDKAVGVSIGTWNPKTPEQIQSVKAVSKRLLKLAKKQINDEQNPAEWSEEDIMRIDNLVAIIENRGYPDYVDYLKKLKNRILPQPKQEWSEEDEQYLLICKNALAKYQVSDKWDAVIISQWLESRLKSLRHQNNNKWNNVSVTPKFPCNILFRYPNGNMFIFRYLEGGKKNDATTPMFSSLEAGEWIYLDNVKPQNKWKPSGEQIEALANALSLAKNCGEESAFELRTLYEQLKKLREE